MRGIRAISYRLKEQTVSADQSSTLKKYKHIDNSGQIKLDSKFGSLISRYASDPRYKNYLEIGTFNGRGSTFCFYDGFKKRTDSDFMLQTYEVNKDRFDEASHTWKFYPNIDVINGIIMKIEEYPNINDIMNIYPGMNMYWYTDDIRSMTSVPVVRYLNPDVILLDGSEYLTHFEGLRLLKDTEASVFILDDTNLKCKALFNFFLNDPDWRCVDFSHEDRNGWGIFEKIE